jgi:hypothetical protein
MLWLWIEAGAPWAGTYAALRNEAQQAAAVSAVTRVFGGERGVLARRCGGCHALGKPGDEKGRPLPFSPEYGTRHGKVGRPTTYYERIVIDDDPHLRYNTNVLLDYTRPQDSALLLGPLAREAGGWGSCGDVFRSRDDPDLRALLAAVEEGKALLDGARVFGTEGFRPNRQYLREMVRFGVLESSADPERAAIDPFGTDQRYWRSLELPAMQPPEATASGGR